MEVLRGLRYVFYLIFHPFNGFWDLKHEKKGNLGSAFVIVGLLGVTFILRRQATGFIFNTVNLLELNIFVEIMSVILPFALWCVANWSLTTLLDGEGSIKDIIITSAYALAPLVIINLPLILVSNVITLDEGAFYYFFISLSVVWAGALMLVGTSVVHQYSMTKTLFCTVAIVIGMGLIIFIGMLFFSLIQQVWSFIYTVYKEISLRL